VSLTVCVTGKGAGVDSVWEQKKLESKKMLENAAESPASSAHFVSRISRTPDLATEKNLSANLRKLLHGTAISASRG
jgi:hypothetical protein